MHELTNLDLVIIVLYMIGMLFVGVWFVKRIKNTGDYYVAGRTLGPFVLTATVCASIIGGSAMMGRAGIAYTTGFKAVMTAIPYLIGMFIFSAIAGRIQEVGFTRNINSIPELFNYRFNSTARCILAFMIVFTMMGTVAAQVTATATIIKMLGNEFGISYEAGALAATLIFIIYTAASGLFGVVYTDVLQFFMLIIFVYILIPFSSIRYLGGFSSFWQNLDKSYLVPHINGSILGDIVTYLVFTLAGAEMWQRAFAAKSKKAATQGMFWGTSIYMVTIALVFFMGLAGQQILPDVVASYGSSDAVVPALAVSILPPGLTGLALAGILSVMMSTADSYLLVSVQTFVHDLGKNFMPEMTEKHEILMSRVMSVVLAMGALIIALYKCLQCAHVCLVLLRGGGRPALPGGPVLEKSHQPGHHICHDRRLCGMCGLETGRQSLGTWRDRSRRSCLRNPAGGGEPCHLQKTSMQNGVIKRSYINYLMIL